MEMKSVYYIVVKGIFEGRCFRGEEITISGEKRIWDSDSQGRSYPVENCVRIGG